MSEQYKCSKCKDTGKYLGMISHPTECTCDCKDWQNENHWTTTYYSTGEMKKFWSNTSGKEKHLKDQRHRLAKRLMEYRLLKREWRQW